MHTRIMLVLSTATEGEHVEGAGSEAGDSGLKGYRKRWMERSSPGQCHEQSFSDFGSGLNADADNATAFAKQQKLH